MPMVEGHVQACLNFTLSFCLRVRAVAWRHGDYDVSRPTAVYAACDVTSCNAGSVPVTKNYSYTMYMPLLLRKKLKYYYLNFIIYCALNYICLLYTSDAADE